METGKKVLGVSSGRRKEDKNIWWNEVLSIELHSEEGEGGKGQTESLQ